MLTGSYASSFHGRRRLTHDIDLVVDLSWKDLARVIEAFPAPQYYLDEHAAKDALLHGRMFNVIDSLEGEKIDFWMLREHPFDLSMFARRARVPAWGMTVALASAEDTIIQKLRWSAACGGSEKQLEDARQVVATQGAALDIAYIEHWIARLGFGDAWRSVAPTE